MPNRIIQLPRNFIFISKLPLQFKIKVIEKGNTTSHGTWYKVIIEKNELNILSKVALQPGKIYSAEKKTSLSIKLLGEFQEEQKTESNKIAAEKPDNMTQKEKSTSLLPWPPSHPFHLQDYVLVWFMNKKNNSLHIDPSDKSVYFQVAGQNSAKTLSGAFIPNPKTGSYELLFHFEKSGDLEEIRNLMNGLPISAIKQTSLQHLALLRKGLNFSG